jgi:hypothetical protein
VLVRFSREDQYLREALWHVQSRNEAWARGDIFTAWRENRILEKYFEPALDTPTYVARSGHRWPDAQRADAASRAGGAGPFMSRADTPTLMTWSKTSMWVLVAAILGLIALSIRRFARAH